MFPLMDSAEEGVSADGFCWRTFSTNGDNVHVDTADDVDTAESFYCWVDMHGKYLLLCH